MRKILLGGDSIKVKEINNYLGKTLLNLKLRNKKMLGGGFGKMKIGKLGLPK